MGVHKAMKQKKVVKSWGCGGCGDHFPACHKDPQARSLQHNTDCQEGRHNTFTSDFTCHTSLHIEDPNPQGELFLCLRQKHGLCAMLTGKAECQQVLSDGIFLAL